MMAAGMADLSFSQPPRHVILFVRNYSGIRPTPKISIFFTWISAQIGQDGYGDLPPRSRKWYTRRHRRYFIVKDAKGDIFEIYLDYSNRSKQSWWLVTKFDKKGPASCTEQSSGEG